MQFAPSVPNPEQVAVIVVDDARFTCEMIRRALTHAGFSDTRIANGAEQALTMMRERRADILIADWLMPQMDGLSLTACVRQLDEETHQYTYIVMLTAREGPESLAEAFRCGVDDFITKSHDHQELLARIHAASRVAELQNDLLQANRQLRALNQQLEESSSFDAITGLGNRAYLERQLDNLLRHVESRGGSACCALMRLNDVQELRRRYGDAVIGELVEAAANRLQQATRPLDVVARVSEDTFGVLMLLEGAEPCHPNALRRIHQALNLRAYKTAAGFLSITAAVTMAHLQPRDDLPPVPQELVDLLGSQLDAARIAGAVHLVDLQELPDGLS